jgi:hypothetical protein
VYLDEEKYWHEKSRDQWLKDGDSNTSYFHRVVSNRKKKKLILNLEIEGQMSDSFPQIEKHIIAFYKNLFGKRHDQQAFLYENFWDNKYLLHEQARNDLEKPFTLDELKEAVFGSNASGALGPDGFTFALYQHFWDIIQTDLMLLITHFYNNSLKVVHINHAMVCLIPKEHGTSTIQKFRPISLLDCSYKILSKILTNRLAQVVPQIVDEA